MLLIQKEGDKEGQAEAVQTEPEPAEPAAEAEPAADGQPAAAAAEEAAADAEAAATKAEAVAEKLGATLEKVQEPAASDKVTMQQLPESEMEAPAVPSAQPASATIAQDPAATTDVSAKRPREEPVAAKVPPTPGLNVFPEATAARALDDAAAAAAAAVAGEPDAKRLRPDPIVAPALAGQSPKMEPSSAVAPIIPADTSASTAAPVAAAPADATIVTTMAESAAPTAPASAAVPMDAGAVPPSGTTCLLPSSSHNPPFSLACVNDTVWQGPFAFTSLLILIEIHCF